MREFSSQLKNIANELAGVGNPVQHEEYVDAILASLPQDYAQVIAVIEGKFQTPPISEVKALLAHESHNNNFCKQSLPSVNYTTTNSSGYHSGSNAGYARGSGSRGGYADPGGVSGGRRGGGSDKDRGGHFANFQC